MSDCNQRIKPAYPLLANTGPGGGGVRTKEKGSIPNIGFKNTNVKGNRELATYLQSEFG